ncbi:type VI secretion system domain-containing protein [Pantoea sp. 1.19]|uniref:type VI secretion system domain-containing protein n=1 Tax=Pantoea sp. 1.19 TaxID=1925589 RepID=UPI001F0A772A|nr:type VI secretion system domain-containing protein [Pantoea sp. 1.19]
MKKGDTKGPEAALAWLHPSQPGMDTPRHRWLMRLLMARMAEQGGRNGVARHLPDELTAGAPQLSLVNWEPARWFALQAHRLTLLRRKAGRSESDKTRLMPEMDNLPARRIAIEPARATVLCG